MSEQFRRRSNPPTILATDLDGTLIPLPDTPENTADLEELREFFDASNNQLVFVTGRSFELVQEAIDQHDLPIPNAIICDVGSTICFRNSQQQFEPSTAYETTLAEIVGNYSATKLRELMNDITDVRLQEEAKQGRFKLSYYVDQNDLASAARQMHGIIAQQKLPWSLIQSVDPFTNDGLIDLLPLNVSKAFALNWWAEHHSHDSTAIIFAGDSGNDLAAFCAGYLSIVVSNADRSLAKEVENHFEQNNWQDRLFLATRSATSGVLEGCRTFGLVTGS